jgi:hypothetical protein
MDTYRANSTRPLLLLEGKRTQRRDSANSLQLSAYLAGANFLPAVRQSRALSPFARPLLISRYREGDFDLRAARRPRATRGRRDTE